MKTNRTSTAAKKVLSLLLCIALLFLTGAPRASADELDDLRAEYDRITQKIAESEKKIREISADKSKQQAIIKELNEQIDDIERQMKILTSTIAILQTDVNKLTSTIAGYEADIKALSEKIVFTDGEITARETELESTKKEALARMRASYMAGNPSKMEILMNSKDLSVFFYNLELLKQLAIKDEALIDKLKGEAEALGEMKKGFEKDKTSLESIKTDLVVKLEDLQAKKAQKDADASKYRSIQNSINTKYENAKDVVAKLDKNSAAYKEQLADYEREREEADKRIDAYIAEHGSSTGDPNAGGNDGVMTWPVPYSTCEITEYYPRYKSGGKHHGIDIVVRGSGGSNNSLGKDIVAAQGGTVKIAGWDRSFGNYILIDHGGGLLTLYAHASKLVVGKDTTVSKGQKIAEIGSTGNSTGPHLHFEVHKNNNGNVIRVNPLDYVSKP